MKPMGQHSPTPPAQGNGYGVASAPPLGPVPAEKPMSPEKFAELTAAVQEEIGRLIVGQEDLVRDTLIALLAGGHGLLAACSTSVSRGCSSRRTSCPPT